MSEMIRNRWLYAMLIPGEGKLYALPAGAEVFAYGGHVAVLTSH